MKFTSKPGILVVVTAVSGAGQDSVMGGILNDQKIKKLNFKKVVTCADRLKRPNEIDGVDYHFVTYNELLKMDRENELVEPITTFGTTHKATSKKEIERFLNGENLVWRIDLSRASEIASGHFFKKVFPENAEVLQKHTIVLFVTAPKNEIEKRRKDRDGERYDPKEYLARDNSIKRYIKSLEKIATPINNSDGKLKEAIDLAAKEIIDLNEKISK